MATSFDYVVRKKMIKQKLRDMSRLADSARQIEKWNADKEKNSKRMNDA